MKTTYSITEAQAGLPGLIREAETGAPITLTRHDKTVAYVISRARMQAVTETLELISDRQAMEALEAARDPFTTYTPLDELDED